jgi:hypothetical protein
MSNEQDYLNDANDAAEQAEQSGSYSNFGLLTTKVVEHRVWVDKDGNRTTEKVDPVMYQQHAKKDRFVKVEFEVNLQEFKPDLDFNYTREVDILGGKESDWKLIVNPSLKKVFGKKAQLSDTNGVYVEVQDVPQTRDPEYNTIKFIRKFKSREECLAAMQELVGGGTATPTASAIPSAYNEKVWNETMVPSIKGALAGGKSPEEVAKDYNVGVEFVTPLVG